MVNKHMMAPVACPVLPMYFQAIVSEGVYGVDRKDAIEYIMNWVKEHFEGYYLRDEDSPFDCHLIDAVVFKELYLIKPPQPGAMFQRVTKKP